MKTRDSEDCPALAVGASSPTGAAAEVAWASVAGSAINTIAALSIGVLSADLTFAAELPVPCSAGACGATGPTAWVSSGSASAVFSGPQLVVNQQSDRAILNWQSFNISADGSVEFRQPGGTSVALNEIFQGDPAKILGALKANGTIYLINQNGIVFGNGARVNVGGLIASTLDLAPDALQGLLGATDKGVPAFQSFKDAQGASLSRDVHVEQGAELTAQDGGQLMLFGTNVTNDGKLSAPAGQVILAAGDSIYLGVSTDPNLRGLLIEVGQGGTATNGQAGVLSAARGNITVAGAMVNQLGRVSATSSVRENGSVRLLARDSATLVNEIPVANRGGDLRLGSDSVTEVTLEHNDDDKTVDATPQAKSSIELDGRTVSLESRSSVAAPAGTVEVTARSRPTIAVGDFPLEPDDGRLVIASDAKIDVSGARIERSVTTNLLRVELRGSQLADSPEQRDGPLRGKAIVVDIRRSGTRADGTTWEGSPIGDLSGDIATIQKTVEERSLAGGEIHLASSGALIVDQGATLNVSGGQIDYLSGIMTTSKVVGADGRVYDIGDVDRDRAYLGVANGYTVDHPKWGVTETIPTFWADQGQYEAGYVEGKDAGSVSITAPRIALDGSIVANNVAGIHQRTSPAAIAAGSYYRPVDQIPLPGRLALGTPEASGAGGFLVPDVDVRGGFVLDGLPGSNNGRYDPLVDPVPDALATVRLRPDLFGPNALGGAEIYSNGEIRLGPEVSLALPNGAAFLARANSVDIEGRVSAPGGSVSLAAAATIDTTQGLGRLVLGPQAVIDVAGRWTNDLSNSAAPAGHDPITTNGGAATLSARDGASLDLEAGSLIDVSAGAYRNAKGAISGGVGGAISISVADLLGQPVETKLGAELRAQAVSQGGRLSLTVNGVCLADRDCSDGTTGTQWIDLPEYVAAGFSSLTFGSDLGGVEVLPQTVLQPRQVNYLFSGDVSRVPSGTPLRDFATIVTLPDYLRGPLNLALVASPRRPGGAAVDAASFVDLGILEVGKNAAVDLDVGGELSLQSSTSIVVDGLLSAPGGSILLDVTTALPLQGYAPSQGISLGDSAALLANGAVVTTPDPLGLPRGTVLDGGVILVRAERGYVATSPSSLLEANGAIADLVIGATSIGAAVAPQTIASSGGTIDIAAAEGLLLSGALSAAAGQGPGAGGGALRVTLDGNLHGIEPAGVAVPIFPLTPRELRVVPGDGSLVIGPRTPLPSAFEGVGILPVDRVAAGGFSSITLASTNLFDTLSPLGTSAPASTGSIRFDGSMSIVADRLRLDTPRLVSAPGAEVSLSGSYVALGYDDVTRFSQTGGAGSPGTSQLEIKGSLIDLIGTLGLDGFSATNFTSSGDVRFRGVQEDSSTLVLPIAGSLLSKGSVTFEAEQVYATTRTDYQVTLDGPGDDLLTILAAPGQRAAVSSAASSLLLSAGEIVQRGAVLAPFGTLTLQADKITLAAGSVTSTSGAGTTVPFGTVQVGKDWTYQLPFGQTVLYTDSGPPGQRLSLNARDVVTETGAVLDLRGGGDLEAYEFIPGPSGTRDVLANSFSTGQFAILPKGDWAFAPIDSSLQAGFVYSPGDDVYLSGYGALPAGDYTILPARYALLPGAYLVRPVAGYTDIAPGERVQQLDGSVIVSGYRTVAGTSIRDPRTSGFAVLSGDQIPSLARYDVSTANEFYSSLSAAAGVAAPRLPRDAGQLQLIATGSLDLQGELLAGAASGGRGSLVDVSAMRLQIAPSGSVADPTAVFVPSDQLNALGADSLLIGGLRQNVKNGIQITTTADSVLLDAGTSLESGTITVVARNQLTMDSTAQLLASGPERASPAEIDLSGSGAMLRVSTAKDQSMIVRTGATGTGGSLTLGAGALIASTGSAVVEASGAVQAEADYALSGGSLAFSVSKLALGDAPADYPGLALSPAQLSSLGLTELTLTSSGGIDWFGTGLLQVAGRVSLRAPGLAADAGADATIRASEIAVASAASSPVVASAGSGALHVDADTLHFDGGEFTFNGFDTLRFDAATAFYAAGAGHITAAGSVQIATPRVTTANGADFGLITPATIDVFGTGQSGSTPKEAGVGGSILLHGDRVTIDTTLLLPAGVVSLVADGADAASISLSSAAKIDVSGFRVDYDGQTASGDGGVLRMTAAQGGVSVASGALLDVSAGSGKGDAGRIDIRAPNAAIVLGGQLQGESQFGAGGQISLNSYVLPALDSLNAGLNAGGFTGARLFHQRGPGDLVLAESPVRATNVVVTADQGSVIVRGAIIASSTTGGTVQLSARDDVDVEGPIDASAGDATASGGQVELWSELGGVYVRGAGAISVAGATGGTVAVRAPRDALLTLLDGDPLNDRIVLGSSVSRYSNLTVEGFQSYAVASGSIDATYTQAATSNPIYNDAASFMQSASAMEQALGSGAQVLAGVELDAPQNLTLAADWNLEAWRFDGRPGVLTLRANGDLTMQRSLSDGFDAISGTGAFVLPETPSHSWSYRLVAGADLGSSDVLAVNSVPSAASPAGRLTVAAGTQSTGTTGLPTPIMVRTGDGNIDLAASGDLVLGNRASVIYTAGVNSQAGIPLPLLGSALTEYPVNGGDITASIGGNIVGSPSNQFVTGWLWRTGRGADQLAPSATAWNVSYQRFEQGIGALAGGDISIRADGAIQDLSVSIATIGRQVGGTSAAASVVEETGGGRLDVESGGDITGGAYYVGRGVGDIRSWGRIGIKATPAVSNLAPTLGIGDTIMSVKARRDLTLEAVANPFLLPQSRAQSGGSGISYFSTYTDRSALSVMSTGGDIDFINTPLRALTGALTSMDLIGRGPQAFLVYPGTLSALALAGDLTLGGKLGLWPSSTGNLDIMASGDLDLAAGLTMSDADPATLPSVADPTANLSALSRVQVNPVPGIPHVPVHSAAVRQDGLDDPSPVRIFAGGDLLRANLLYIPKPIRLIVGGDIVDLNLNVEQLNDQSASLISAGGGIRYDTPRDAISGLVLPNSIGVQVEGPGLVSVESGGAIDLGTSAGLTSTGSLLNPSLPDAGAQISVLAGARARDAKLDDFEQRYLEDGSLYDQALKDFVAAHGGGDDESKDAALAALRALPLDLRYQLSQTIMFAEIRAGGRAAAAAGPEHSDYTRAFDAIETLFPGSASTDANPYHGDTSLFFSRIYTLAGGDISLVTPGGLVNVGLATPPAAFGITKQASELGIVAQRVGSISSASYGDFQVNESRVFAADGGDILVWSTQGDIDAGRGAKTAVSAPAPTVTIDQSGNLKTSFPAALQGSGIQALSTSEGVVAGDVDLYAPRGVVNAGDAGIVAGNLTIGATAVLGADNITVSGVAVGVPVDTGGFAAALTGVSAVASSAANSAEQAVTPSRQQTESETPLAAQALGFLDIFVTGFGESCDPKDASCAKDKQQ